MYTGGNLHFHEGGGVDGGRQGTILLSAVSNRLSTFDFAKWVYHHDDDGGGGGGNDAEDLCSYSSYSLIAMQ